MSTVRIQTDATERIQVTVLDGSLDPITGKTDILLSIVRVSDGWSYDFNDDNFKVAGWTTRETPLTQLSALLYPGEYYYDFDTSAILPGTKTANETYMIYVRQSPGTDAKNMPQTGEIKEGQWPDHLDANITSRATQADILNDATPFDGADIAAILADTLAIDARLPTDPGDQSLIEVAITASESAIRGADGDDLQTLSNQLDAVDADLIAIDGKIDTAQTDLTAIKGAGFDSGDSLKAAGDDRATIEDKIDDIAAVTRFRTTAPSPFEVPSSGSVNYRIHVNMEDTDGNPEDPDADTITVGVTNQTGTDRSANLSSTTMTKESVGRYRVDYTVANTHPLEQLMFTFTYDENAVQFIKNMDRLVTDSAEVGYTATDRSRDDQVAVETAAIDGRLPGDPADQSDVETAITTSEGNIRGGTDTLGTLSDQLDLTALETTVAALNDLSIADVQTALTGQGYTSVRAALLDNLDKAISVLNDLSITDVRTALTDQGYTTTRAVLLDNLANLDATISSVVSAIAALNDLDQAGVQAAMTTQGYTTARAALLDHLDADISAIPAEVDTVLSLAHGGGSWVGTSSQDWSTGEREQIRDALGVDGTKDAAVNGQLQTIGTTLTSVDGKIDVIQTELARLLGLGHENTFMDNTSYDVDLQLVALRVRIFDTKAHCDAATDGGSETLGLIATYQLTTTWEGLNRFQVFKQTLE